LGEEFQAQETDNPNLIVEWLESIKRQIIIGKEIPAPETVEPHVILESVQSTNSPYNIG